MKPYPLGHTMHSRLFKGPKQKAAPLHDPPVTEKRSEIVEAQRQTSRDAKKRKGQLATLVAGETGGYGMPMQKQKLGGGSVA